ALLHRLADGCGPTSEPALPASHRAETQRKGAGDPWRWSSRAPRGEMVVAEPVLLLLGGEPPRDPCGERAAMPPAQPRQQLVHSGKQGNDLLPRPAPGPGE